MSREQMVQEAADLIEASRDVDDSPADFRNRARDIRDIFLPQVTTVAELEALDPRCVVIGPRSGVAMRAGDVMDTDWPGSPTLTVVWQPEVTA